MVHDIKLSSFSGPKMKPINRCHINANSQAVNESARTDSFAPTHNEKLFTSDTAIRLDHREMQNCDARKRLSVEAESKYQNEISEQSLLKGLFFNLKGKLNARSTGNNSRSKKLPPVQPSLLFESTMALRKRAIEQEESDYVPRSCGIQF